MMRFPRACLVIPLVLIGLSNVAAQNANLTGPTPVAEQPSSAPPVYVRAGKLLDVRSGRMLADRVVGIRGGRIERVAAAGAEHIPAGGFPATCFP